MTNPHNPESEPFISDDGVDIDRIPRPLFVFILLSYTVLAFGAGICFPVLMRSFSPPAPIEQVK